MSGQVVEVTVDGHGTFRANMDDAKAVMTQFGPGTGDGWRRMQAELREVGEYSQAEVEAINLLDAVVMLASFAPGAPA